MLGSLGHLCFLAVPLPSFCIQSKFWPEWEEWPLGLTVSAHAGVAVWAGTGVQDPCRPVMCGRSARRRGRTGEGVMEPQRTQPTLHVDGAAKGRGRRCSAYLLSRAHQVVAGREAEVLSQLHRRTKNPWHLGPFRAKEPHKPLGTLSRLGLCT